METTFTNKISGNILVFLKTTPEGVILITKPPNPVARRSRNQAPSLEKGGKELLLFPKLLRLGQMGNFTLFFVFLPHFKGENAIQHGKNRLYLRVFPHF